MHTVCHSILSSNFLIPKLNGVVHKTVWRVTARFRSRPVPWCSSASSAAPSGIRFSGCPPLSAQGSSSPGFPGSAASACCFRTCRGTDVEPIIRKIKDSGTPRQRYPVRPLACGGEPFQRDRLFQPPRLLTGASFLREKLSTRRTQSQTADGRDKRERPKPAAHPVPRPMPLFPGIWPKRIKPSIPCCLRGTDGLVIL